MQESERLPGDVRIWRDEEGTVRANVPHLAHHSPSGFEFGYGGSGPADLALSILAAFVPVRAGESTERLYQGRRCSLFAWQYHQEFKREFIAPMTTEGGLIASQDIRAWIDSRRLDVI